MAKLIRVWLKSVQGHVTTKSGCVVDKSSAGKANKSAGAAKLGYSVAHQGANLDVWLRQGFESWLASHSGSYKLRQSDEESLLAGLYDC